MSRRKKGEPAGVSDAVGQFGGRLLSELCTLVAVCRCESTDGEVTGGARLALRSLAQAICDREEGDDRDWAVFRTRLRKVLAMYAEELETMDPKKPGGAKR